MDTSQTSQTFSVDSLNYERNLSTSSSNAPQASPGTNLLSLPEEGEAANLVPSSAPQSKADHLGGRFLCRIELLYSFQQGIIFKEREVKGMTRKFLYDTSIVN